MIHAFPNSTRYLIVLASIGFASLSQMQGVKAADASESQLNLNTERVIVFKDGYSLVIKHGSAVTNADGEVYTNDVPDSAVLGSFWATPKEGRMTSMVAGWVETTEEIEKQVPCTQVIEVVKANVGKKCSLLLKEKGALSGEIREVLAQDAMTSLPASLRENFGLLVSTSPPTGLGQAQIQSQQVSAVSGTHFVLRTDDGDNLVAVSDIARLTIDDMKTTVARKVKTTKRTKRLRFRFAESGKRREVTLMYFRPGVRWIPTYRVNLTTNKKKEKVAEIAMQAEIVNEAEDLKKTKMDIVVGVPNFRYRSTVSPLVLESTLRNTVAHSSINLPNNSLGNNYISNARFSNGAQVALDTVIATDGGVVDLPNELTAGRSQDLFIYNLPALDLKKGERSAVPILSTEVPYRDVYTWELHVKRNDIAVSPSGSGVGSPLHLVNNQVWRQIELINNTKVPWTTGAAMIMDGQQPLAQEILTYTSSGQFCRVPVTISVDTRGRFVEKEVSRQLRALTWDARNYVKIKQQATPTLANSKAEPITAEVTLRFGGKAEKTSHDGDVTLAAYQAEDWQRYRGDPAVNNSSVVRWNVTIEPGDVFAPHVEYSYYTRQ